jgi:hypothetical protein
MALLNATTGLISGRGSLSVCDNINQCVHPERSSFAVYTSQNDCSCRSVVDNADRAADILLP